MSHGIARFDLGRVAVVPKHAGRADRCGAALPPEMLLEQRGGDWRAPGISPANYKNACHLRSIVGVDCVRERSGKDYSMAPRGMVISLVPILPESRTFDR